MTIRRLIMPLTVGAVLAYSGQAFAQGAFPAPLPAQAGTANDPAFPPVPGQATPRQAPLKDDPAFPPVNGAPRVSSSFPVNGAAPFGGAVLNPGAPPPPQGAANEQCLKEFAPLRDETEKRGKLIKAASDRHAQPVEACKLFKSFSQAEVKMMNYVALNATKCGIPPQISETLKKGHKTTETMEQKICTMAQQPPQQQGPTGPTLSEVLGSSAALPEASTAKKGGTTFDTLNGNVLAR